MPGGFFEEKEDGFYFLLGSFIKDCCFRKNVSIENQA